MITGHSSGSLWVVVILIGIATYALRLSFIFLFGRVDDIPLWAQGVLRFVPPAVLAALIVPALIAVEIETSIVLQYEGEKILAAAVATLVAWRTKNVLATIAVGMITLWGLQAVL